MRKRIRNNMMMVIGLTLAAAYAITIFFVYGRVRDSAEDSIRYVAQYAAAAVNVTGEDALEQLDAEESIRITLIDDTGEVFYDTVQDEYTFENHLERPEVQEALSTGYGQDVRKSDTTLLDTYYYAVLLENGDILRASMPERSIAATALSLLPVMLLIAAAMMIVAWIAAGKSAKKLVEPINRLDLDHPLDNHVYEELHPLLQRIEDTNRAKEEVNEMRREFSANVSHELKTPLTSISGYAEIMKNGLVREDHIEEFSGRIYKEAQRLLSLIDDLIKISRLDEGRVEQTTEEVDLFELSREILSRLSVKADDCSVHLELTGESCVIPGVRRLLDEMIYNLVENAIKYNHPGGRVDVWAGRLMDVPEVIVTDTGIGIAPEDQERIFERFYRVDKSRSKETGGTGLGLSIVKHSAELSGAQIRVTSELGKGTKMEVIFSHPEML